MTDGTDHGIVERLEQTNFTAELAAEGVTTVSVDDDGNLVEHRPDGTTRNVGKV